MIRGLLLWIVALVGVLVRLAGRVVRKIKRRLRRVFGLVLAAFVAVALLGCPMPAPDGCTPAATRCSPAGIPQVCSQTQRWTQGTIARPCADIGAVCCPARSPFSQRAVHACVPQSACIAEQSDGGVE